ncbi:MAG: hypothetical protein KatS3mg103_0665 [Phycisphaerales bacterium]|nr:MAG: hypothetical protein KatS3mg103_0665 [Phycisphaerales bacterium]
MDPLLVWGLLLLAAAAFIGLMELFVPSAGILGIVALVVAVAGVVCLWRYETAWGVTGLLGLLVLAPTGTYLGFKVLPYTPIGKGLILASPPPEEQQPEDAERNPLLQRMAMVGRQGQTLTDLRPIGVVSIDGRRLDAVAETGYIPKGQTVKVVSADGIQLKVRQVEPDEGGPTDHPEGHRA